MIGERIRVLREAAELTQTELAEQIGISQGQLARFERDERIPRVDILERAVVALGVTMADLYHDEAWAEVEEARAHYQAVAARLCRRFQPAALESGKQGPQVLQDRATQARHTRVGQQPGLGAFVPGIFPAALVG